MKVAIFGATGAIGSFLIDTIAEKEPSWNILAVSRSGTNKTSSRIASMSYPNLEIIQGDAENLESVLEITRDVDIVYSCVGFAKYEAKYWAVHWPIVVKNLLEANQQHKNKLVFCDNLYAYGPGTNISTKSDTVPPSSKSKPGIRAMMRETFVTYMNNHKVRLAVVGGADFFGPYVTTNSLLGDIVTGNLVQGKAPMAIGNADRIHDFCYAPDFANALYIASINDQAYNKFWICPHTIHNRSVREVTNDIGELVGTTTTKKLKVLPGFGVRILGLFDTMMSEFCEMLPFWTMDYTVNDSDFMETFHVQPTPYKEALQSLVDFYKAKQA